MDMDLFEEIKKSLFQLERLIEIRYLEDFIARGYDLALRLYYTLGKLIDIRILNKGGSRHRENIAFLLLRLFYVYIWTKGESPG